MITTGVLFSCLITCFVFRKTLFYYLQAYLPEGFNYRLRIVDMTKLISDLQSKMSTSVDSREPLSPHSSFFSSCYHKILAKSILERRSVWLVA